MALYRKCENCGVYEAVPKHTRDANVESFAIMKYSEYRIYVDLCRNCLETLCKFIERFKEGKSLTIHSFGISPGGEDGRESDRDRPGTDSNRDSTVLPKE